MSKPPRQTKKIYTEDEEDYLDEDVGEDDGEDDGKYEEEDEEAFKKLTLAEKEFPYKLSDEEIKTVQGLITELDPLIKESQLDIFYDRNINHVIIRYNDKVDRRKPFLTLSDSNQLGIKKALIPFILKELISQFFQTYGYEYGLNDCNLLDTKRFFTIDKTQGHNMYVINLFGIEPHISIYFNKNINKYTVNNDSTFQTHITHPYYAPYDRYTSSKHVPHYLFRPENTGEPTNQFYLQNSTGDLPFKINTLTYNIYTIMLTILNNFIKNIYTKCNPGIYLQDRTYFYPKWNEDILKDETKFKIDDSIRPVRTLSIYKMFNGKDYMFDTIIPGLAKPVYATNMRQGKSNCELRRRIKELKSSEPKPVVPASTSWRKPSSVTAPAPAPAPAPSPATRWQDEPSGMTAAISLPTPVQAPSGLRLEDVILGDKLKVIKEFMLFGKTIKIGTEFTIIKKDGMVSAKQEGIFGNKNITEYLQNFEKVSSGGSYQEKYLKYKNKYLQLKQKLNL
jgi:hypothetical protein